MSTHTNWSDRPAYVLTTEPDVHQASVEDARARSQTSLVGLADWAWTGQAGIGIGDWIALYVTKPHSAICWLGRAVSPAVSNPERAQLGLKAEYWFCLEMVLLPNPVSLASMRNHPALATWGPVVQNFQSRSRRADDDVAWNSLVVEAISLNPEIELVLEGWRTEMPEEFVDPEILEYSWSAGEGSPFPYIVERDMQADVHDSLCTFSSAAPPREVSPPLDLPSLEPVLAPDSRADILLGVSPVGDLAWLIVETKLFADSRAVGQVLRYADILRGMRSEPVIPWVVAQAFSSEALRRAAESNVSCWRVRWPTEEEREQFQAGLTKKQLRDFTQDLERPGDVIAQRRVTPIYMDELSSEGTPMTDAEGPGLVNVFGYVDLA